MSEISERQRMNDPGTVLHWYDFICPFCYVGQQRNAILVRQGLRIIELGFQAHPDIPPGGIPAGPGLGQHTQLWSARPQKPDCRCIGLHVFPIRGMLWLLPNGCGDISQILVLSYTKNCLQRTLFWGRTLRIRG